MVTAMLVLKKIWEGIVAVGNWCWQNKYVPVAVLSAIVGAILYHKATDDPPVRKQPPKQTDHVKEAEKAVEKIHDNVAKEHQPKIDALDRDEDKIGDAEKIHDEKDRLSSLANLGHKFRGRRKDREGPPYEECTADGGCRCVVKDGRSEAVLDPQTCPHRIKQHGVVKGGGQ